ncbi:nitrate/sulfonate/bicarbonate ABC transporter ATP-binding protein [Mycolicibacterium chitae]|uniref:ABC transporter n=1 Tax=Mycolicibacterium chitae TaxID=1792 RepID=A0A448I087_MYCCI|nr:ABC transporter ATP-binding protein [Mycolicibacterium chitae]MCV7108682.1 ABC transporter ATP-binding protein [Mycolicibacterium chitae]BBZ02822.1 nitrate/sulfonate/bicarbonate ABC transporter ATP-binding protein [Mycolicibacterium chitae]VEG45754.1 ABC transporter [Mycolicibacterium chitae]
MADISVSNLHKEFGLGADKVIALENVNLEISGHAFVSIVGASGCGKSTLLNILSGIDTPTSGRVSITQNGKAARAGYVFQAARLLPWRSVMDNMLFVQTDKSEETRARCQHYLEMVQLGDKGNKYPGELSGGMQQRVGIARAFSTEPDVLFMDEPFSHLDAITARTLRAELHNIWNETGKTVVFVTHDVGEAVELSNRILVFAKGGRLADDITVRLPFPRDVSDADVAVTKAEVFKTFEDIGALAVS